MYGKIIFPFWCCLLIAIFVLYLLFSVMRFSIWFNLSIFRVIYYRDFALFRFIISNFRKLSYFTFHSSAVQNVYIPRRNNISVENEIFLTHFFQVIVILSLEMSAQTLSSPTLSSLDSSNSFFTNCYI